ncbi:MAG: alpha/beta fold hydrolase [Hyphomicrobiales bacterium]|nr:alpha/beta fold hydrolase [Hyphomicrobiales bacterium]
MTDGEVETITVAGFPTLVKRVGQGPAVLVLHGGPGFDHRYIAPTLRTLARRRTLVFYDQPGSGSLPDSITADDVFRHCAAFINEVIGDQPLGLVAHSWGVLVALGAVTAGLSRSAFDEGMLVAPVPVDRSRYDIASGNLFARFPDEVAQRYAELAAQGYHEQIVKLLLPYYSAGAAPLDGIGLHLDINAFLSVTASLGPFDFTSELSLLSRCATLVAGKDFTTPDLVVDLLAATAGRHDIADAGHFPGHEEPGAFNAILGTVFSG